ncbi:tripartite tricarboxylate transporter permease [Ancylobacter sp. G4_0304]|uniref:tripartite tricarboxylate transporter permease n=1 Tax=Ancylobacter sp. G4_0304 TaxID=3114289 RepID=UPI0039C6BBE7
MLDLLISNFSIGFAAAFSPENLLLCFVGALLGTLIGVLPGIGSVATIAMLLPITFGLPPTSAMIMLAGIYYGAHYGGSTTAILVNLPGEASSVITCLDGYALARAGRAGEALALAAIGSFIAGCLTTFAIAFFGPALTVATQWLGAPDYFALMVLGLLAVIVLSRCSMLKALIMLMAGFLLSMVGTDLITAEPRMTFGIPELSDGISFVAMSMGLFGISEIIANYAHGTDGEIITRKIERLLPSRKVMRQALPSMLRGTGIGMFLGMLPGGGGVLSSFCSYAVEKKFSKHPEQFGRGAVEGVAGPEAANNAGAQASFIPLLSLGIPSNAVMALMGGALLIQGITPGPHVIATQPELFWGIVVSMWVGNVMLLVINLPLIGLWVKLLAVPYRVLAPMILVFCCIGAFSVHNSVFDVLLMMGFGVFGYLLMKLEYDPTPLLLAFILGPLIEENLRRALQLSDGSPAVFIESPISAVLLILSAILVIVALALDFRARRAAVAS